MLNDDKTITITIINPSVVRPQSYISLRARWEILFSLGYLPLSIYLYIHYTLGIFPTTTRYKKWGPDSKYPKRAIESDENGLAGGNKTKKGGVSGSLSLSSPIMEMKPRDFLLYTLYYLGR